MRVGAAEEGRAAEEERARRSSARRGAHIVERPMAIWPSRRWRCTSTSTPRRPRAPPVKRGGRGSIARGGGRMPLAKRQKLIPAVD